MIAALDSSFDAPTLAQAQAARGAGVQAWGGYLATQQQEGAFNLAAPWSRMAFWNVQQAGLRAIAFCSGWDDPGTLRQLAAEWNVLLLADVEDAIRGDGPWVGPFLEASGAGLYGLLEVHRWPAPYRIVASYSAGCTGTTWPAPSPPVEPHGWQCQGTHRDPVTGLSVDSMRLDDWFGGGFLVSLSDAQVLDMYDNTARTLSILANGFQVDHAGTPEPASDPEWLPQQVNAILAALEKLQQPAVDPAALAAALAAQPGFVDTVAGAVAHRFGAALDKA